MQRRGIDDPRFVTAARAAWINRENNATLPVVKPAPNRSSWSRTRTGARGACGRGEPFTDGLRGEADDAVGRPSRRWPPGSRSSTERPGRGRGPRSAAGTRPARPVAGPAGSGSPASSTSPGTVVVGSRRGLDRGAPAPRSNSNREGLPRARGDEPGCHQRWRDYLTRLPRTRGENLATCV